MTSRLHPSFIPNTPAQSGEGGLPAVGTAGPSQGAAGGEIQRNPERRESRTNTASGGMEAAS